jgi:hypothetical protein
MEPLSRRTLGLVLVCAVAWTAPGCARGANRLRSQARQLRAIYEPFFGPGLADEQGAISWPEFEAVARMDKAAGVDSLTYFNRYGEVRWSRNAALITSEKAPYSRNAMNEVWRSTSAVVAPLAERGRFDVYIPFVSQGEIQGVLLIRCLPDGLALLIAKPGDFIGAAGPPTSGRSSPRPPDLYQQAEQDYLDGIIYFQRGQGGDREKARSRWTAARALDPGNPNPAAALARLDRDAARR